MYFLGLDLAWGPKNRTGVAVLDRGGHLLSVCATHTDDEITEAIAPYILEECVVAIDAPLLVTNEIGKRPAEAALSAHFQRFDAAALPAAKQLLAGIFDPPRGGLLADRLGLDIDPESTSRRRAIEVYPHPAMVAIFRLGLILKFKKGKAKEQTPEVAFASRKSAMLRLMNLIEGLEDASPRMRVRTSDGWMALRDHVETATRPMHLNAAEDPIDAVFCAYLAMYFTYRRDDVTIYGNYPTNGYIATPTLPADLTPDKKQKEKKTPAVDPVLLTDFPVEWGHLTSAVHEVEALWSQIVEELDSWALISDLADVDLTGRVRSGRRHLELARHDLLAVAETFRQLRRTSEP